MAWKEYSELSNADKQHQDAIQKMIVCQSQLDRAVTIARDRAYDTNEDHLKGIKDIASNLVDWVYKKANEKDKNLFVAGKDSIIAGEYTNESVVIGNRANASLSNVSLPTPTAAQKKVLDVIQDKTGIEWDIMCKQVLDIAEKDYNMRKYPENMDSVNVFVKALK